MAAVALRRMRSSGNIPPIAIASSVHRGASIALGAFCLSLGAAWAWQLKALLKQKRIREERGSENGSENGGQEADPSVEGASPRKPKHRRAKKRAKRARARVSGRNPNRLTVTFTRRVVGASQN